ncbi:MAG TPA: response regulator transcription factor [Gemmatimonadales bacterium]|nr:response regulator transcription factor [Gemmatimonadales bacterium]
MRVLIVEDDLALVTLLRDGFREHGFQVVTAGTLAEGRSRALLGQFTVIVLDVLLPGGNGIDLCRTLRERGVIAPILMLTALDAVEDRVRGLEAGADDYLAKPFAFRELMARVHALSRRPPALAQARLQVLDLEIDFAERRVRRAGRAITLTAREFDLLAFFARHLGRVVTRREITADIWDENHDPMSNALEVLVRRLRAKIDDGFEPPLVGTLRGAGYRFGPE